MATFSLHIPSLSGASATVYARVDRAGQLWNTSGTPAFEAPLVANVAAYTVAMAEADTAGGGTGWFTGTLPATIPASALIGITAYQRAGASAAFTDPVVGNRDYGWDGTTFGIVWANVTEVNQVAVTGGIPSVNVTEVNGAAVTAGVPAVNVTQVNGGAVTTPSVIDANVTEVAGQTASAAAPVAFPATVAAPGDSMKVEIGTAAGQINASGGKVPATVAAADVSGTLDVNAAQVGGQTASAAAPVTFPATIAATGDAMKVEVGIAVGQINVSGGKVPATVAVADVSGDLPANVTQVGGQTASAAAPVAFPAAIGTSTYAGADTAGTATLLSRITGNLAPTTGDAYALNLPFANAVLFGTVLASPAPTTTRFTVQFNVASVTAANFLTPEARKWAFYSGDLYPAQETIADVTQVSADTITFTFATAFNSVPAAGDTGGISG